MLTQLHPSQDFTVRSATTLASWFFGLANPYRYAGSSRGDAIPTHDKPPSVYQGRLVFVLSLSPTTLHHPDNPLRNHPKRSLPRVREDRSESASIVTPLSYCSSPAIKPGKPNDSVCYQRLKPSIENPSLLK